MSAVNEVLKAHLKSSMAKQKEDANADILKLLLQLSDRMDNLEKEKEALPPPVSTGTPPAITPPVTAQSQYPIPIEYREIVDTLLNKRFGIEINYMSDTSSFEFSILVPRDYSNAAKPHWETYKEDRRSRVIINALGANGVREWTTLVYNNFDMETKARITHDRSLI